MTKQGFGRLAHPGVIASGLLFAALALRLFRLGAQSLWLDEGGTWHEATQRSWADLIAELWSPRSGYPLYHLLMKIWTGLAGDSEAALRLPSALAGAALIPVVFWLGLRLANQRTGLLAALVLLVNPFAIWQSQDAKAYSMLMLLAGLSLLTLWQALERPTLRRWLAWSVCVVLMVMMHRLALFLVIGEVAAAAWLGPWERRWRRGITLVLLLLVGGLIVGITYGLKQDPNAPAVAAAANPLAALWQLLGRWPLYRASDQIPLAVLPWVMLIGLGVWQVWRSRAGVFLLATVGLPLGLFGLILAAGTPLYEARYFSFVLPLWAVLVALGLQRLAHLLAQHRAGAWALRTLVAGLLTLEVTALILRPDGVWSGKAVKENYRGTITELARRVTPDDAIVVHPAYLATQAPLYHYYARRVTPDPLPAPITFGRVGAAKYNWGEFDNDYSVLLADRRRAWLMIAPLNARLIDPPDPRYPEDDMGRVGINFLTADQNEKWRCLDVPYLEFGALRLLCQSFPRPMKAGSLDLVGAWPAPQSPGATFSSTLVLAGYEFRHWRADQTVLAGGTLPISLALSSTAPLGTDYRMFIHLLPELGAPLVAQYDSAPLGGGLPTSRWQPGVPIHDEVAVYVPPETAPGRYQVLLGWYNPAIQEITAQRLPVTAHTGPAGADYIELGTVEVRRP